MIKIVSVIEATTITGPAQVLLEFYRSASASQAEEELDAIDPALVTFQRRGLRNQTPQPPNHFVATARAAGLNVEVIDERFRFDPRVIGTLKKTVERHGADLIETHHVKSHFLLRVSGLWKRRPWIAYHHGYTFTDAKMRLYNQLDRWSLRAAARVITVSQAAAQELIRGGVRPERIHALHNSIDPNWARDIRPAEIQAHKTQLGITKQEPVILAVGRLSREKAHVDLLHAFARLRQTSPDLGARLVIVGDGPERRVLEQKAASLKVAERVTFVGHAHDVRPYYALASLMALPSLSEGSPIALLEAMVSGVPVVATKVGGVPEIVTHGESALLVSPRDPDALANAIEQLFHNALLAAKLAANARDVVLRNHSPQAKLRARMEIYRAVIQEAGVSPAAS
jgi:glycosyltransferase involved in cell wall biosynthesis